MNWKYYLSLLILVLSLNVASAQQLSKGLVENPRYENMLEDLLSHTVNELGVEDVYGVEGIVFLDAREWNEFAISHIKEAVWIGYDDFDASRIADIDKDEKIVVYCSVGYRSEKISEKLLEMGYKDVSNLYGSLFEWMNQGKPVYNVEGEITKEIHAYDKDWGKWVEKGVKKYK